MPNPLHDIEAYNKAYINGLSDLELIVLFDQVYAELKQRIIKIELPTKEQSTNEMQCSPK